MRRNQELKARKNSSILPMSSAEKRSSTKSQTVLLIFGFITLILTILSILNYEVASHAISLIPFSSKISHNAPNSFADFSESKYFGSKKAHGLTSKKSVINEKRKYIFPPIEDLGQLRLLGYDGLFEHTNIQDSKRKNYQYSKTFFEGKVEEGVAYHSVLNNFQRNGRRVYGGKEKADIVLVTSLNFENSDPSYLVKIVQNRVDYAFKNENYGVYARWAQEFLPVLNAQRNDLDKWSKALILKEAMIAFPDAKWFWYIDSTSFIMRDDIDLKEYVLSKNALEPIILRGQSLLPPNGVVKTFNNNDYEDISLILTQSEKGLNTDNFLIKNDLNSKALLELWSSPLIMNYMAFKKDENLALSHLLQWHPLFLSKTVIIPPRTISSISPSTKDNLKGSIKTNEFIYQDDDFVVTFSDCKLYGDCDLKLQPLWEKSQLQHQQK